MEVLNFKYLVSLNLIDNNMTTIPPEIAQLTIVYGSLSLRGNQLTSLPDELWQMPNLEKIMVDGNRVSQKPAEINGQVTW